VGSISQRSEELRLYNLGLEFDNFKPLASKRYLQMHLRAERFVFSGMMIGVF
jgi:hypothetical protein